MKFALLLVVIAVTYKVSAPKKILMLPWSLVSHMKQLRPFAQDLAAKGHDVMLLTIVQHQVSQGPTSVQLSTQISHRLRILTWNHSVVASNQFWTLRIPGADAAWTLPYFGEPYLLNAFKNMFEGCMRIFRNTTISEPFLVWLRDYVWGVHWDAVIFDGMPSLCNYAILGNISAPKLIIHTTFMSTLSAQSHGLPRAVSYVPDIWSRPDFVPHQFRHRLQNALAAILMPVGFQLLRIQIQAVVRKRPLIRNLPHYDSQVHPLVFHTFWRYLDVPRPQLVNSIQFYDWSDMLSSRPRSSVREVTTIDRTMWQSKTVLVTFGHMDFWSSAPKSIVSAFQDAFNSLRNVTVLWQLLVTAESSNMTLTRHVRVNSWWPQRDLLCGTNGQPMVDVFVTHGGAKSVHEALACGVDRILIIPMWADEAGIAARAQQIGAALVLPKCGVTQHTLHSSLNRLLTQNRSKKAGLIVDASLLHFESNSAHFWFAYAFHHKPDALHAFFTPSASRLGLPRLYFVDMCAVCMFLLVFILFAEVLSSNVSPRCTVRRET